MKDLNDRLGVTGQLLVRSGLDIARQLQEICDAHAALLATLKSGELLFMSKLLQVDPQKAQMVIACSEVKHANSALLAAGTAVFTCNHQGAHYGFSAGNASMTQHAGAPALRLALPTTLLAQQRRAQPRVRVPVGVPLRCLARLGPVSFEARVIDISTQGLGGILYDPAIRIEVGTRLEGTRIMHPQGEAIVVDLLVRNVAQQRNPDGSYVMRAGCSFIGTVPDVEKLIQLFVTELEP
jgi:c-di-GMP-binding flagellar brake protein YcgR